MPQKQKYIDFAFDYAFGYVVSLIGLISGVVPSATSNFAILPSGSCILANLI